MSVTSNRTPTITQLAVHILKVTSSLAPYRYSFSSSSYHKFFDFLLCWEHWASVIISAFAQSSTQTEMATWEEVLGTLYSYDEILFPESLPKTTSIYAGYTASDEPDHASPMSEFPDEGYLSRIASSGREPRPPLPVSVHVSPISIVPAQEPSHSQPPPSRSQTSPRRRCPVESCVKGYQKKGYFIKHFVKEHEKYFRFYTALLFYKPLK